MKILWSLFIVAASVVSSASNARPGIDDLSSFCSGNSKSIKFNDTSGFTNVAIRQHDVIKAWREIASQELDWALYDIYSFSDKTGERIAFSRAVIYAGNPIVYVQIVGVDGRSLDNRGSLPDGFFVPSEKMLKDRAEFCALSVKQAGKQPGSHLDE